MAVETQLPSLSIDIVLSTIGRTAELAQFMEALSRQSYRRFRLIVVDQNADARLSPILEPWEPLMTIVRVGSPPGLNRARNVALRYVQGDVVALADDDCWYPPDLLARVATLLDENPNGGGVTGRAVDESGHPSSARWDTTGGTIDRFNVWKRGSSITVFLRTSVIETVGPFDETLGAGSGTEFGSGDETDYLIRTLEAGFTLHYDPSLTVFHPHNRRDFAPETVAAGRLYGAGMGRVLRKHAYPWWFAWYHCLRAIGGAAIALACGRPREARFHWAVARGRARGWLARR
jgi:GT2 family glycosyltransferase